MARASGGFDFTGAVTVTAALIVLVYAVIEAPDSSAGRTTLLALVSAALFALFVLVEKRSAAPLVPLRLFRSRALVGGNLITIAFGLGAFGLNYVYTQYAQLALGISAIQYGLMSSVLAAAAVCGSMVGQNLVTRIGARPVAAVSLLLTGVGATAMSRLTVDSGYFELAFWGLTIFGAGLGAGTVGRLDLRPGRSGRRRRRSRVRPAERQLPDRRSSRHRRTVCCRYGAQQRLQPGRTDCRLPRRLRSVLGLRSSRTGRRGLLMTRKPATEPRAESPAAQPGHR